MAAFASDASLPRDWRWRRCLS